VKLRTPDARVIGVIALYSATAAVVAVTAGIDWAALVGAIGTAIGTLGLAYYSFRAMQSSRQLERTALRTLRATRRQARAAAAEARQAERARIDALAPIIDVVVSARDEWFRAINEPGNITHPLRTKAGDRWSYADVPWSVVTSGYTGVHLDFLLTNYGKTPAFVQFASGVFTPGELIRVPPSGSIRASRDHGHLWNSSQQDPANEPRTVTIVATIHGPLTGSTIDTLTWTGAITMLSPAKGPGNRVEITKPDVLRMDTYAVLRAYPAGEK
jgi:hypothetical protein